MNAATIVDPLHSKALPDLVSKLLVARQQSLVLYNKLAALKPFTLAEPVRHLLRQFRQSLIDYLALGPFEVYQALEEQPLDSPFGPARDLARQLYASIASTTQVALAFHDRYGGTPPAADLAGLGDDLSRLGENLAERIELEDRIVAAICRVGATLTA
ncbi:MAG: Rsd/AlgQ family anti-sigma factor [Candidatus Competibacter sp.]|nr:Rsd/AlgQ family anti-sigma factor [Candidatus Competibacter sp.]MDG4582904.1 Rsd/AlgQ family anti-sigma factor [Candidatus Competibacter sp.]